MPFLPVISGWHRESSGANARLHVSKVGRQLDRRRLCFVLSRELIEQAGWQGGERVVIALGVGDDLGGFQMSRVSRQRAGVKLIAHSNARGFRIHLTLPPAVHGIAPADFLDRIRLPAALEFEVRDGALLLRCPVSRTQSEGESHVLSFPPATPAPAPFQQPQERRGNPYLSSAGP